jgi:hypothetical protein
MQRTAVLAVGRACVSCGVRNAVLCKFAAEYVVLLMLACCELESPALFFAVRRVVLHEVVATAAADGMC